MNTIKNENTISWRYYSFIFKANVKKKVVAGRKIGSSKYEKKIRKIRINNKNLHKNKMETEHEKQLEYTQHNNNNKLK